MVSSTRMPLSVANPATLAISMRGFTPTPTATPTPTGILTPTPTGVPIATPTPGQNVIQCPSGFVETISGSNIICVQLVQSQSQTASSTSNASTGEINITNTSTDTSTPTSPVVVIPGKAEVKGISTVTQLPKTGLPEVVWLISGLTPAGLALKRFGLSGKHSKDARFISQQREFLKDLSEPS